VRSVRLESLGAERWGMGMLSLLHLDPEHLARRMRLAPVAAAPPSLAACLLQGSVGFTLVAIAGFAPWALAGPWFHRAFGELGMYLACTGVFVALSGPVLHRLVIGPGALARFAILFTIAYLAYAALWIAAWMTLGGNRGSLTGLGAGSLLMGWILCRAFTARGVVVPVVAALLVGNLLGYYGGGYAEAFVAGLSVQGVAGIAHEKARPTALAMLSWGVCYGLCLGAGLGAALYLCQAEHRAVFARVAGERALAGGGRS
jgi:hypothetical protein